MKNIKGLCQTVNYDGWLKNIGYTFYGLRIKPRTSVCKLSVDVYRKKSQQNHSLTYFLAPWNSFARNNIFVAGRQKYLQNTLFLNASRFTCGHVQRTFFSCTENRELCLGQQRNFVRCVHSTAEKKLTPEEAKIMAAHRDFCVKKADKSGKTSSKTLVVFFGFYGASERAIESYCEVYHKYCFDVVYVKSYLKQFAWPRNSQALARVFLQHIKTELSQYENILVHAMSMGAFNFTIVMGEFYQKPEAYGEVLDKIRAVIYDSIVIGSLKHMSIGVGRGASENPVLQRLILLSMSAYLNATYPCTVRVFNHYIAQFKERPLNLPTLVFYAKNDTMSDFRVLNEVLKEWQDKFQIQLVEKCWDKSKHARHLQIHKEDYLSTLHEFLNAVPGLLQGRAKL